MSGLRAQPREAGVSLVETLVAAGLLAVLVGSVLPVTTLVARAGEDARLRGRAQVAAVSHLERLRALPWYALPDGTVVRDDVSHVSADGFAAGGAGLDDAPIGALDADTAGYVDAADAGGAAAAGEPLARRWEIRTHPAAPACRVLRVEVARQRALDQGVPMARAALARAQTIVCAAGARP